MISSINPSGSVDSYSSYAQFNNNGYLIDEELNPVQSDRFQRVAKQFNELSNKMGPTDVSATFSIANSAVSAQTKWYEDATKKMVNGERFSTSTDDSDSSGSFKNGGGDHSQVVLDIKCDEDKPMPDHHARRPMNAFLIFCKRHRGIVRERYPNLENRAITKILGDWWANLNVNEKSSYTNLAKEYKDAFFNANPDFKWYKLPAPPLRTGCPRTTNDRHSSFSSEHDEIGTDFNMRPAKVPKRTDGSGVSTFKLADEAQMGGLSSLMVAAEAINGKCANNNNTFMANSMEVNDDKDEDKDDDTSDCKDELHRVLGETHSFLQNTMKGYQHLDEYPFESHAPTNNNIPRKSFHSHTSSSPEMKSFELDSPDDEMNDSVFGSKKSSRACKGKRYLEFMNAQKINVIGKRTKPRTTSTSSSTSLSPTQPIHMRTLKKSLSCSPAVQKLDYDTFDHLYANHSATIIPSAAATKNETDVAGDGSTAKEENAVSPTDARKFDVTEFELEQRINALPAHNLDEYLVRKQDTKKKKKVNEKRSGGGYRKVHKIGKSKSKTPTVKVIATTIAAVVTEPKTIEEAKKRLAIVGSQKRKARKESITRRDVQQVTAIVQGYSPAMDPQFIPVLTPFGNSPTPSNTNRVGNSGLLMLATMAEVAAANYAA